MRCCSSSSLLPRFHRFKSHFVKISNNSPSSAANFDAEQEGSIEATTERKFKFALPRDHRIRHRIFEDGAVELSFVVPEADWLPEPVRKRLVLTWPDKVDAQTGEFKLRWTRKGTKHQNLEKCRMNLHKMLTVAAHDLQTKAKNWELATDEQEEEQQPSSSSSAGPDPNSDPFAPLLSRVPFHFVTTAPQLAHLAAALNACSEFAFDVEHSVGFFTTRECVCLLQISTRQADFVIDLLQREVRENAHLLKAPFENSHILKIFHGSNDFGWLLRDFGIWTTHFVDMHMVVKLSLSRLLYISSGVHLANKRFKTANWLQRPLPWAMLQYARMDSNVLLRIHDFLAQMPPFDEAKHDRKHWSAILLLFVKLSQSGAVSERVTRCLREQFLQTWREGRLEELGMGLLATQRHGGVQIPEPHKQQQQQELAKNKVAEEEEVEDDCFDDDGNPVNFPKNVPKN